MKGGFDLSMLAAVEKEMKKGSRNLPRFSPKISRPRNPMGKLFELELDQFSLSMKGYVEESMGSLSTEGTLK